MMPNKHTAGTAENLRAYAKQLPECHVSRNMLLDAAMRLDAAAIYDMPRLRDSSTPSRPIAEQRSSDKYEPKLTLTGYQSECYRYARWTGPGSSNLGGIPPALYCAMGIAGEAGELMDKLKKVFRDSYGEFAAMDLVEIRKELGDVLWYVGQFANMMGWPLGEVAQANLNKLEDRRKRGVLHGSGDNR